MENKIKLTNIEPQKVDLTNSKTINIVQSGTSNYEELENKPSINNVELTGNKTLDEMGIQPKGEYAFSNEIPTNVSELNNDSDYATKEYVDNAIASIVNGNEVSY